VPDQAAFPRQTGFLTRNAQSALMQRGAKFTLPHHARASGLANQQEHGGAPYCGIVRAQARPRPRCSPRSTPGERPLGNAAKPQARTGQRGRTRSVALKPGQHRGWGGLKGDFDSCTGCRAQEAITVSPCTCELQVETFSDIRTAVRFALAPLIGGWFELVSDSQRDEPTRRRL
jgi:hypothetical protein